MTSEQLTKHLDDHHYWQGVPNLGLNEPQLLFLLEGIHEKAKKQGSHPDDEPTA